MSLTKGCQGSMGSTSSWSFRISLRAERALGHLGFHLTSSFPRYSFRGHLVVMVGGWGIPQAGVAVALLAKIKGGCTVSATVSANKVGVGGVVVAGSSQSACMTGSLTGGGWWMCQQVLYQGTDLIDGLGWGVGVFCINSIHSSAHFGGLGSGQCGSQTGPVRIITGELKLGLVM